MFDRFNCSALLFDGDGLFVSGFDKIVETFYDRIIHAEGTRNGSRSGGDEEQNLLMWKLRGSLGFISEYVEIV